MPKGQQYHYNHHNDSSEPELASEIVSETIEQNSEVEQEYQEVYRYEPGSSDGPTEKHIFKVEHHVRDHRDDRNYEPETETFHEHEQGHENGYQEVHEHQYEEQETELPTEVRAHYEQYQEQVYDEHVEEHEEQVYEEHTEVNRNSSSSTNSFDQVAKEMARDLDVLDQVDDQELRNLAELIPERNQDRLFSEDDAIRSTSHNPPGVHDVGTAENGDRVIKGTNYISHEQNDDDAETEDSEMPEMPRPPPSFVFRTERLSKNVADAMATIWDKFWSEDVKQISTIFKNRFSQLLPYIRRFLAHLVAFWGGITYIRRALTAFIRILNRDERVRELLERVGWASATTVRVFLSICAMVMQATLQMYYLVRNKIIPDTRRVIPILYYKAIIKLLQAAQNSPWSLVLGPFSLTFAIDYSKVPDRYYMHNKLAVPHDDVTFASENGMQTLVQSMREGLHRTRHAYGSQASTPAHTMRHESQASAPVHTTGHESQASAPVHTTRHAYGSQASTPVHTQTTDELPYPPPSAYTVSRMGEEDTRQFHHHETKHNKENPSRYAPLSERTNQHSHFHGQG